MLPEFSRPASRRKFTAFRGYGRASLLLLACLCLSCLGLALLQVAPASAHEGHDQEPPPTAATTASLPRLVTRSEVYELVAILEGERLTIYLDRFEDNAPVADATVKVAINGETVAAEA